MAFGTVKGWSLAGLDRWSSYGGAFVYKMHRDLMNVELLDRWSSYRGGALDRFDCTFSSVKITAQLRDLVLVQVCPVHRNHYILKLCGLFCSTFRFVPFHCCGFGKLF